MAKKQLNPRGARKRRQERESAPAPKPPVASTPREGVKVHEAVDEAKLRRRGVKARDLTRQQRRDVERAKRTVTYELHPSGYNREERRKLRKYQQQRDAEENRWLAEGRVPRQDRPEDLDELLDELDGGTP